MNPCDQVGAYVVDALADDEREEYLRHLAVCERCQVEVAELSETVAALGSTAATAPPPALRAQVLQAIGQVPQLPPVEAPAPAASQAASNVVELGSGRASGRRAVLRWGLAAATVGVVGLGAAGSISGWRTANNRAEALAAQNDLLAAPDAKLIPVALPGHEPARYVVSRQQNRALFVADRMPELPATKTYQQWTLVDGRPIPDITFRSADAPIWLTGDIAQADQLAMTVEDEGGAQTPSLDALVAPPVDV